MCWKRFLRLCVRIGGLQTNLVHTATCCNGVCPHPSMLSYRYVTGVIAGQWRYLLFFFVLFYGLCLFDLCQNCCQIKLYLPRFTSHSDGEQVCDGGELGGRGALVSCVKRRWQAATEPVLPFSLHRRSGGTSGHRPRWFYTPCAAERGHVNGFFWFIACSGHVPQR